MKKMAGLMVLGDYHSHLGHMAQGNQVQMDKRIDQNVVYFVEVVHTCQVSGCRIVRVVHHVRFYLEYRMDFVVCKAVFLQNDGDMEVGLALREQVVGNAELVTVVDTVALVVELVTGIDNEHSPAFDFVVTKADAEVVVVEAE